MYQSGIAKHSFSANCHFWQDVFNKTKLGNIDSLYRLIACETAENIDGSRLNLHFH